MFGILKNFPWLGAAARRQYTALITGPPGGGKGTISKYLVRDFGFTHLSTGDLLRHEVAAGSDLGVQCKSFMDAGDLVPDELIVDMVLKEVAAQKERHGELHLLLDGFPRTRPQAEALEEKLPIDASINLDVPTDVLVRRISSRWIHPTSGRSYAYDFNPPKVEGKDDVTGEPLIQRDDDKPETVRRRLDTYTAKTKPLLAFYEERGLLHNFPGTESKVIYADLKEWLQTVLGESDKVSDEKAVSSTV